MSGDRGWWASHRWLLPFSLGLIAIAVGLAALGVGRRRLATSAPGGAACDDHRAMVGNHGEGSALADVRRPSFESPMTEESTPPASGEQRVDRILGVPRRGISGRVQKWATRGADPIPTTLTIAGLVLSVFALGYGLYADWKGFAINVCAAVFLLGPGLVISNVIVKRIQVERASRAIQPRLITVLALLHQTAATARQACEMLGIEAPPDLPSDVVAPGEIWSLTIDGVTELLKKAAAAIPERDQRSGFPSELEVTDVLVFPVYRIIRRVIYQMDGAHPMPTSVSAADAAESLSEHCSMAFLYYGDSADGRRGVRDRVLGLWQISNRSVEAPHGTTVFTAEYLWAVDSCLLHSRIILGSLRSELPESLR